MEILCDGNIRVFCRVRPFFYGRESICSSPAVLQIAYPDKEFDARKITLQCSSEKSSKNYEFDFDRVFGPGSTQAEVFEEISQLIQSVLDGYNVCIFAYGQTGSGKTFTMEAPEEPLPGAMAEEEDVDRRGMISRAVEQVFSSAIKMRETGWEYKMSASILEIHNETLRDLLTSSSSSGTLISHEIKMDPERPGQLYVTNLTQVPVTSEKQVP